MLRSSTAQLCKLIISANGVTSTRVVFLRTARVTTATRKLCTSAKGNPSRATDETEEVTVSDAEQKSSIQSKNTVGVGVKQDSTLLELEKPIESKIVSSRLIPSKFEVMFEKALTEGKTRENFVKVLDTFVTSDRTRRGHMELLTIAMDYMVIYEIEKDLLAYNAMLNVFPRGRFQNRTLFDAIWAKQHPQVNLALEILTKMEENVIKPSIETYDICEEIFGKASQPVQKCRRLAYWLTKLEEMFPSPLPAELPEGELELSMLALERMTKEALPISVYQELTEERGQDFIVGIRSAEQENLIETYDTTKPVYIEGPYFLWMKRLKRHFYTLRAHAMEGDDPMDDEGSILAVCMANPDCSRDALRNWVTHLQGKTPNLTNINVIFNLNTTEQQESS